MLKKKENLFKHLEILKEISLISESSEIIEELKKEDETNILNQKNLAYFEEDSNTLSSAIGKTEIEFE